MLGLGGRLDLGGLTWLRKLAPLRCLVSKVGLFSLLSLQDSWIKLNTLIGLPRLRGLICGFRCTQLKSVYHLYLFFWVSNPFHLTWNKNECDHIFYTCIESKDWKPLYLFISSSLCKNWKPMRIIMIWLVYGHNIHVSMAMVKMVYGALGIAFFSYFQCLWTVKNKLSIGRVGSWVD